MADTRGKKTVNRGSRSKAVGDPNKQARSLVIAVQGIHTSKDFANFMGALMSDLIEGRVTPSIGNATCNAGGKMLKVIELEQKYGLAK